MSAYENYNATANTYDQTRSPVGIEIIVGCLSQNHVPLSNQIILDAGCGTGNYSVALSNWVERINAVDASRGMLTIARDKTTGSKGIDLCEAHLSALPFGPKSFDGVMVNQVLHHLDDDCGTYAGCRQALAEFNRVLKPGGILALNTSTHEQLKRGFWPYSLIPNAREQMCRRHVPLDQLISMLHELDFTHRGCFVPVDQPLQGASYFDPRGPLRTEWRGGDSIWSTVFSDEFHRAMSYLRELENRGELERYVAEHDKDRVVVGQLTFVIARKHEDADAAEVRP